MNCGRIHTAAHSFLVMLAGCMKCSQGSLLKNECKSELRQGGPDRLSLETVKSTLMHHDVMSELLPNLMKIFLEGKKIIYCFVTVTKSQY